MRSDCGTRLLCFLALASSNRLKTVLCCSNLEDMTREMCMKFLFLYVENLQKAETAINSAVKARLPKGCRVVVQVNTATCTALLARPSSHAAHMQISVQIKSNRGTGSGWIYIWLARQGNVSHASG